MADDDAAADRRRRRSTGMGGISALPEHLQHEVFSRVGDVKALFRFAVTCHGWLRGFTDQAFVRELFPSQGEGSGHRARLLGVFVQDKSFDDLNKAMVQARMTTMAAPPPQEQERASSAAAALAPIFLPARGSPLGPAGRALTSFAAAGDDDGTFDYAKPLAARRGIVLLPLVPRTPQEMDDCYLFGVCNPVTGDRHVLAPLDCSRTRVRCTVAGFAIITAADNDSSGNGTPPPAAARWTFSQLFVITTQLDGVSETATYLQSYSAATRRWSVPTRCLDRCIFPMLDGRSAVVHDGAAHWLFVDHHPLQRTRAARGDGDDRHLYWLSVEVATARVSLTRLPVRDGGKRLLCINSDGRLAVTSVYPMHVTVWTLPDRAGDDDDDGTTPAAAAALPRTSFRIAPQEHYEERWYNFNHGSLLALFRGSGSGAILDLRTQVMEEVFIDDIDNEDTGFLDVSGAKRYLKCVPYEMDLVDLFMLKLGGIRERLIGTTASTRGFHGQHLPLTWFTLSTVSERDRIFTTRFWSELLELAGVDPCRSTESA